MATLLHWLDDQNHAMEKLLIDWANINSGSFNLPGLATMATALTNAFNQLDAHQQILDVGPLQQLTEDGTIKQRPLAPLQVFTKRPAAPIQILLGGHRDTVFAADHPFQQCHYLNAAQVNGPGVIDMKGGLVILYFSLLALEQSPYAEQLGWTVLISGDEEIGSFGSAPFWAQYASNKHFGLIFEPALTLAGDFARQRKGSGKFTAVALGYAAHAGRDFDRGRNAIVGLAQFIIQANQLNGQRPGVTLNIGLVHGGTAINVVPGSAICQIDIRTTQISDAAWIEQSLQHIAEQVQQQYPVDIRLFGQFGRPPKVMTPALNTLFNTLGELAKPLAQTFSWQDCGGCCDGNNLAAAGLPTLDTLGACGQGMHSDNEYIELSSLVQRAQLTTALLLHTAQGKMEL